MINPGSLVGKFNLRDDINLFTKCTKPSIAIYNTKNEEVNFIELV
jgi:hypothetical protein